MLTCFSCSLVRKVIYNRLTIYHLSHINKATELVATDYVRVFVCHMLKQFPQQWKTVTELDCQVKQMGQRLLRSPEAIPGGALKPNTNGDKNTL